LRWKNSLIQGVNGCSLYEIYNEEVGFLTSKIDKLFIVIGISIKKSRRERSIKLSNLNRGINK
jgi:hypothetical protein